jgi:hypothetical protein
MPRNPNKAHCQVQPAATAPFAATSIAAPTAVQNSAPTPSTAPLLLPVGATRPKKT